MRRTTWFGKFPDSILTTKSCLKGFMEDHCHELSFMTVKLITEGREDPEYMMRLCLVCSQLMFVSRLFYRGKNGPCKLPEKEYEVDLFEGFTETKEEVRTIIERQKKNDLPPEEGLEELSEYTFDCLLKIRKLWCRMISRDTERPFLSELAYAADYVLKRKGQVPMPVYAWGFQMFPDNYEDFDYWKGEIAEYFDDLRNI